MQKRLKMRFGKRLNVKREINMELEKEIEALKSKVQNIENLCDDLKNLRIPEGVIGLLGRMASLESNLQEYAQLLNEHTQLLKGIRVSVPSVSIQELFDTSGLSSKDVLGFLQSIDKDIALYKANKYLTIQDYGDKEIVSKLREFLNLAVAKKNA